MSTVIGGPGPRPFLLAAEGLNKSFSGFRAIRDLSFYVDPGELRTVIGPNGAGKTTFLDLITGRTAPDTGTIKFEDSHNLTEMTADEIYRLGIGRKFQSPTVYTDHTVWENLLLALEGKRSVWSSLFGRLSSTHSDRIDSILQTINLVAKREIKAGALSHGQKQWLEVGMLLAQDAKLMLVDEPTAGLTEAEIAKTGDLLLSLTGKHTIVVIAHDMGFVRQISAGRKVTVLHQGSVLCEGPVEQVQANEKVIEVYLGRSAAH